MMQCSLRTAFTFRHDMIIEIHILVLLRPCLTISSQTIVLLKSDCLRYSRQMSPQERLTSHVFHLLVYKPPLVQQQLSINVRSRNRHMCCWGSVCTGSDSFPSDFMMIGSGKGHRRNGSMILLSWMGSHTKCESWGSGADVNQNKRYEQGRDAAKKERRGPASLFLLDPQVSVDDLFAADQGCIMALPSIRRESKLDTVLPFAGKVLTTAWWQILL
jgi:hypothetical protein